MVNAAANPSRSYGRRISDGLKSIWFKKKELPLFSFEVALTAEFCDSGDVLVSRNSKSIQADLTATHSEQQKQSGHPWSINPTMKLDVKLARQTARCFLLIVAEPLRDGIYAGSRLRITVNGNERANAQTWAKRVRLAIPILVPIVANQPLPWSARFKQAAEIAAARGGLKFPYSKNSWTVQLEELDNGNTPTYRLIELQIIVLKEGQFRPIQNRQSPNAAEAVKILSYFESLGDNCEFGLVQRQSAYDSLALFRFSYISLDKLLDGLKSNFGALLDPSLLEMKPSIPFPDGRIEWISHQHGFGMFSHTDRFVGPDEIKQTWQAEYDKLKFLQNKFMEDLADGEKIFVRKANYPVTVEEMIPLWIALQQHGANRLLWVVKADDQHQAGHVEWIGQGFMKGYIGDLAPYENVAYGASTESWMAVCRSALALIYTPEEQIQLFGRILQADPSTAPQQQ